MTQKRSSHDAIFRAAQNAERAFGRRKAAQLRQSARAAQQAKNWAEAESLWRQSLAEDPGERMATAGLAQVLVYNGKTDEAARLAERIVAAWPEDENGPTVLARIAEDRGDTDAAIAQWRRVLELAPGRSQALIRLGRLLIASGSLEEAKTCADQLALYAPDNPNALALQAEIDAARGDHAGALARRRQAAEKFPELSHLWHEYGAALIAAGDYEACEALVARLKNGNRLEAVRLEGLLLQARQPEAGHTDFWRAAHEEFPRAVSFLRRYVHAALRDGRREEAAAALESLFATRLLTFADTNSVIGMANLLDGDGPAVRRLVRDFLKRFRGTDDYRRIALRLSRVIFQHFPRRAPPADATAITLRMLQRTQADPATLRFLVHAADVLHAAKAERRLLDTDISPGQCAGLVAEIRRRLAAGQGLSLIRVGDAESSALDYAEDIARHAGQDADERERVWWGRTLAEPARAALALRVREAMRRADILGVPSLDRLLRDVKLERRESLAESRPGRGIQTVLRALEDDGALAGPRLAITSAHLQHDLEKWSLFAPLFAGLGDVVAVSCHPGLPDAFAARFEARIGRHILVPPRHASLATFGLSEMGPKILPEVLDDTLAALDADLRGRLVIIGAGYAGKVIVDEAARRGGVALDLGSVFDYWMGAATRSYQVAALRRPRADAP